MNRNRVPKNLFLKLLEKKPKTTVYRLIQNKLRDLNGAISRRGAALLVAKDLQINFSKYIGPEDREELARINLPGTRSESPIPPRIIERKVTKEYRPVKLAAFDPYVPSSLLDEANEMAQKVYPYLYIFENSVRNVIRALMEKKHGPNWWEIRVKNLHKTIDDEVIRRKHEEKENRWHSTTRGIHEIYYSDINDLRIIVQDNWPVFKGIHERQTWVIEHIMQLSYSRNIIAHNNPLRGRDIHSIQTKISEWFDQIKGMRG